MDITDGCIKTQFPISYWILTKDLENIKNEITLRFYMDIKYI